jgi:hypothetical protein
MLKPLVEQGTTKTKDKVLDIWEPSEKEQTLLTLIKERWIDSYTQRHTQYRHLNGRTLEQFWQDSRDAMDAYVEPPENVLEEWQSQAYRPISRNKTLASAASLVAANVGLDFSALHPDEEVDRKMSRVCEDGYEWCAARERMEFKEILAVLELATSGTVHYFEDIVWEKRTVKDISSMDFENGKIVYEDAERVDFKGPRMEVAPNEEVYPGDVWEPEVQAQPWYHRRKVTTYHSAASQFSRYANWKYVRPGSNNFLPTTADQDAADGALSDQRVEIIWYWDRPNDVYAIVVNGILLTDVEAGFPYPHKNYPFAKGIALPFSKIKFYYGNSVPNLTWDEQANINDMWRIFIDTSKLQAKPPVGVSNPELADTDIMVPGVSFPLSPDDKFEVVDAFARGPGAALRDAIEMSEKQADENTMDPLVSGHAPDNDPTATQVRAIVGAAERLRGFSEQLLGDLYAQFGALRIQNILWFLSHDEDFRKVTRDDVRLGSGKNGKRKIIFASADEIPSAREILQAEYASDGQGSPEEYVFVDKDSVNDYTYHVRMSSVPKARKMAGRGILRAIEKARVYQSLSSIDPERTARDVVQAFGDDPDEYVTKPAAIPNNPQNMQPTPDGVAAALGGGGQSIL